jgi:hypothetical protein
MVKETTAVAAAEAAVVEAKTAESPAVVSAAK